VSSSVRLLSLSIIALWKLPAITAAAVPATSERYCRQFRPPPKQIKHFSRMMMPVTKTDEKDAYMIAMYGEKMNPPIYKMPSQATYGSLPPKGLPTLTMQSNYPASSEYVQPINNQEHP